MKHFLRTSLAFVILLAGACAACSSSQLQSVQPTQSDAINRALNSTVMLYNQDDRMVCAGEFVGDRVIITAYHCAVAASLTSMEMRAMNVLGVDMTMTAPEDVLEKPVKYSTYSQIAATADGSTVKMRGGIIRRVSQSHDLAVIVLDSKSESSPIKVRIDWRKPSVGQDVFAVGHPEGLTFSFSRGYISTVCRLLEPGSIPAGFSTKTCWLQSDIHILGGSSGGGLYDQNGELIGICSMGGESGYAFFVPVKYVEPLLSGLL